MPTITPAIQAHRDSWTHRGQKRPPFAVEPGPGQESVWDYPRPPIMVPDQRHVVVRAGDLDLASSSRTVRTLETAGPPVFYLPPDDVHLDRLVAISASSACEWKGAARYWSLLENGSPRRPIGWSYVDPYPEFEAITNWLSFYPGRVECYLDEVRVEPQPGEFYGGWITPEIVGPFKGGPGSEGW